MLRRLSVFVLLLLITLGSGCTRQPRQPGTLRLATTTDPSTLDPAHAYDTTSINYARVLYRGLVDYDEGANIVNIVAREREVSPDGKTYRFKLRPDVHFHYAPDGSRPGRRVVAEDFRYALERVLTPATASDGFALYKIIDGAEEFSTGKSPHVHGIRVLGDDEIAFTLTNPDATFLNLLTLPFAYAVSRETVEALEKQGKTLSENPNGTGPFLLDEWRHDAWVRLKKNPDYFDRNLPKSERIELEIGGDETLHLMRFELGDLDIIGDIPAPDFVRLTHDPKWKPYIQHAPMMDIRYVSLNNELEPFNNVEVRRAMNYAINRERIATFLNRRVTLARGALPPGMPGYNPRLFQYSYDPEKAKQLLKQAGYGDGFTVTLWVPTTESWYPKAAQSIKQDLKNIGVTVNIKLVTYPELKTKAGKRKELKMAMIGWLQDYPDPSNFLDILFNGRKITETASNNRAFYSNPQVNELLKAAAVQTNRDRRLKLYQEAEKLIVADAPWVFLHHNERYVISQPWVTGYKLHPMWSARYEYVGVQQ